MRKSHIVLFIFGLHIQTAQAIEWFQQGILSANIASSQEGTSLGLSSDGNTLAVGAPYFNEESNGGAVQLYIRTGSNWGLQSTITPQAPESNWGWAVALSADGNTLAIGIPNWVSHDHCGATAIYARSGTTWQHTSMPSQYIDDSYEGTSVAMSADASTLAAGAYGYNSKAGAIQIYTGSGNSMVLQATLSQANANSEEGLSVALSADGNTLAAGSPAFNGTGGTHIYTRSGTAWKYQTTLSQGISGSYEGAAVALSADGNTLAVGAQAYKSDTGATHIYIRSGTTWTHQAILSSNQPNSLEGAFISLSGDGNTLVTPGKYFSEILTYSRSGAQWEGGQIIYPVASSLAVQLSADNSTLAIGAPLFNQDQGETFIYVN